jgi:hypothetical protein
VKKPIANSTAKLRSFLNMICELKVNIDLLTSYPGRKVT